MSFRKDIRVDSQSDTNLLSQARSALSQQSQLGFTLDVEDQDLCLDGGIQFLSGLSNA